MPSDDRKRIEIEDRERESPSSAEISAGRWTGAEDGSGDRRPDVVLDVPQLHVGKIELEVENLQAHVSLDAEVVGLVELRAGVNVQLDHVRATVEGVDVSAHLRVHLERVATILARVFDSVDKNSEVLSEVMLEQLRTRREAIEGAGGDDEPGDGGE